MPARGEDARLRAGVPEDLPFVRRRASEWRLDDEALAAGQLLVAEAGGRIVEALIERFPIDEVWITTDLTDYFGRLGFVEAADAPLELREKISSTCRVKGRAGVRAMLLRRSRRKD